MNKCRVLVVGAGMYTCGKGKNEYGTILPSLIEANNLGIVDEISIVTRSSDSLHHANEKCKIIKEAMRSNITMCTSQRFINYQINKTMFFQFFSSKF